MTIEELVQQVGDDLCNPKFTHAQVCERLERSLRDEFVSLEDTLVFLREWAADLKPEDQGEAAAGLLIGTWQEAHDYWPEETADDDRYDVPAPKR